MKRPKARCPGCYVMARLTNQGNLYVHYLRIDYGGMEHSVKCEGSGGPPIPDSIMEGARGLRKVLLR